MIFEIYIWIICFLSVYVSIFWIIVSNNKDKNKIKRKELPLVTIAIPAYNEERGIWNTLKSLTGSWCVDSSGASKGISASTPTSVATGGAAATAVCS